jgi:Icc protein
MLIAHVTDTHIVAAGARAYIDQVDTNTMFSRAVDRLNGLAPRPDCVVITGDLADHGRPEEYAELKRQLALLEIPYFLVIGNHDHRETMLAALDVPYLRGLNRFIHYTVDDLPVRLIVLDSTSEQHHMGEYCAERAAWLRDRLAEGGDRPTVVALHHPPFDTGIVAMDAGGSAWATELVSILSDYPNVERVLCGHIHRSIQTLVGGRLVSVCPSTAHQVSLDLGAEPFNGAFFEMEPPAFQLHRYRDGRMVTHTGSIDAFQKVDPLSPEMLERIRHLDPRAMMMKKDLVF